jgi:transcriptional regulator GlxA family with amidase domain
MAAAMAQAGSHAPVSHAYIQAVQRILSTCVLSEFMDWFPQQLVHVATLAAQARREAVTSRSPLVSSARHYLEHRFTASVSLQHVATALHVAKEHLARVFRQETGETVVKALNRLRLEAAKEQLASSTVSLKVIAGNCGFGSVEHFQRLFRREVGTTPGGHRRQRNAVADH